MRAGLTIGEFATLSHLSVRTLRRYHEAGLLEPAAVDPFTGYRYYSAEQIPPAQVIRRLRDLDVPLAEVKAILATGDPQRRAELITGHLQRLEGELDRTKAAVKSLRQLLRPGAADLHVELRSVPARTVAAISGRVRAGGGARLVRRRAWQNSTLRSRPPIAPARLAAATPTSCSPRALGP